MVDGTPGEMQSKGDPLIDDRDREVWSSLKLTDRQMQLCDMLDRQGHEGDKNYQLGNLYRGAVRVWSDSNNPDRIAQAANSLREIIEKPLWLVLGYVRKDFSEFNEMRNEMADLLQQYRRTGDCEVKNELHDKLEAYLELSESSDAPRAEQLGVATMVAYAGDDELAERKRKEAKSLWKKLQACTHHSTHSAGDFAKILDEFEKTVDLILSNRDAINQREIHKIVQSDKRSSKDISPLFRLIKNNEANARCFFELITARADATWLPILEQKDYFKNPPAVEKGHDGWMTIPFWLPMLYLIKMATKKTDTVTKRVAKIVTKIQAVDSPRVCDGIMEIAALLPLDRSIELKEKVIEYISKSSSMWGNYADKLLDYWLEHNKIAAALDLLQELMRFDADPKDKEKRVRRKDYNKQQGDTTQLDLFVKSRLEPRHSMYLSHFRNMMRKTVPLLINKDPLAVAKTLVSSVSHLIALKFHRGEDDISGDENWYKSIPIRMHGESNKQHEANKEHDEILIDTMKLACRKVYDNKQPVELAELDKILCSEKWEFFKRWRMQLYAEYPDFAKAQIKELIVNYEWYGKRPFEQNFWDMIKSACNHFGERLLTRDELTNIFESINQVQLDIYQRQSYTEDHLRYWQFSPFKSLLFGKYQDIYQRLTSAIQEEKREEPDHYKPPRTGRGWPSDYSPFSREELAILGDEELLERINTWDGEENFFKDDDIVSVNKSGFAAMFYAVFKELIATDSKRMSFWQQKCHEIKHPIYVQEMLHAMLELVKAGQDDLLDEYLDICEKTLTLSNDKRAEHEPKGRREPSWSSIRWPISELVSEYLKKQIEPPASVWEHLIAVLTMLCTQYDAALDGDKPQGNDNRNPANRGLNCIRGQSLVSLINFALAAKKHNASAYVLKAKEIIEQRLSLQTEHKLQPEEYAILGANYLLLHYLDKEWAREHRQAFFPQDNISAWSAAFGGFIIYCSPSKEMLEVIRENFAFALQNLNEFRADSNYGDEMLNAFELRLFNFYLADVYSLAGDDSLLEQYYQRTASDKKSRGNLLYKVGDSLRDKDNQFDKDDVQRILSFFRAQLAAEDFVKMDSVSPWLDVEQLDVKERLSACHQVLKTCAIESFSTDVWLEKFCKMLPEHTDEVVHCFAELVCRENSNILHIDEEKANAIIKAGRNSGNEETIKSANSAASCLMSKRLI